MKNLKDYVGLPQMSAAFAGWTSEIVINKIKQKISKAGFREDEITTFKRRGILQPLSPEIINNKPEGQRSWEWLQLHVETATVDFSVNDIILINGTKFKIMHVLDYSRNNFIEYQIIKDYKN